MILSSRNEEKWLNGSARRYRMRGLKDINAAFELLDKRLGEMNISRPRSASDIRIFKDIADVLGGNPSALEMLISGFDPIEGPGASQRYLTTLRRGVVGDPTISPFSKRFLGVLRCQHFLSVKHLIGRAFIENRVGEFIICSLGVLSGQVHKDWFRSIVVTCNNVSEHANEMSDAVAKLLPSSTLSHKAVTEFCQCHFLDIGLLEMNRHKKDFFLINPLLTYAIRDMLQMRGDYLAFFKILARKYFLDRSRSQLNLSRSAIANSISAFECDALSLFNVFDDMLEAEVDLEAVVSRWTASDEDGTSQDTGNLNENATNRPLLSKDFMSTVDLDADNTEAGLYRLLQMFMVQNIATTSKPLVEETMERCDRYLRRLNLEIGSQSPQTVLPKFRLPTISIAGWAAQFWTGRDTEKAMKCLDFALGYVFRSMRLENEKKLPALYQLLEAQIILLKAMIGVLTGNVELARPIFEKLL